MTKPLIPLLLLLAATPAAADPAPFGLLLGQTTQGQAGTRYQLRPLGLNALSLGDQFDLDPRQVRFDGLRKVTLIFGQDRKLAAVIAELPRERFADLRDLLTGKYRLVDDGGSGGGDRDARFVDGETQIVLDAPPLGRNLKLSYIHKGLSEAARAQAEHDARQRRVGEAAQL